MTGAREGLTDVVGLIEVVGTGVGLLVTGTAAFPKTILTSKVDDDLIFREFDESI